MLKAWNLAAPAVQGSGSLLLLASQEYKQIISQDIVGYCFFFCPLQHYPNLTYDVWGNKIHIVKSCTLRRLRKIIVREHSRQNPFSLLN